jgi:hypothetical protein
LLYFHFSASKGSRTGNIFKGVRKIGHVFIAITFGVIFAGVYFASLAALIERLSFIWTTIQEFISPLLTTLD